jgi:hypothetical protein
VSSFFALLALAAPLLAQLDLPGKPPPKPREPADELAPRDASEGDLAPKAPSDPLDLPVATGPSPELPNSPPLEAAEALFAALARTRTPAVVESTYQRLLALGPTVLARAKLELQGEHAPSVFVAGRLCLRLGTGAERTAVAERLTRPLSPEVAVPLFDELVERDPVLAAPEYVAGLLDHPGTALRARALQVLEDGLLNVPLAALAALFGAQRTATRAAALELVGRHPDPLARNLLASRLADPSAQLARRASELLAVRDDAESLLLERAFPPESQPSVLEWSRARAYALLALVEREERSGAALLEGASPAMRVESLRRGLTSSQPLVAGAAAVALARVGFRASAAQCGPWLEREVPHQLVRSGTGAEFHADFSSLERPALRALTLLSGETFGSDGEAWRAWWVENAAGFRARHARIELGPQAAGELWVAFRARDGRLYELHGPARWPAEAAKNGIRLTPPGAQRLLALLEHSGVFGPERLPSVGHLREASLRVAVGTAEKSLAPRADEDWHVALLGGLEAILEEERWQLHADPGLFASELLWQAESARWSALDPLGRTQALVERLLGVLPMSSGPERDECVLELVRAYEDAAVPRAQDFEALLSVLASEVGWSPRATRLSELARIAAGAVAAREAGSPARERLLLLVLERTGGEADEWLTRLAAELERESALRLAADPRPRARALAARALVRWSSASGSDLERLRAVLADPESSVGLALLEALGSAPASATAEALRDELIALARSAAAEKRRAALAVLAALGGRDARDLALEALGDTDPLVQAAGVEALAELADPSHASLLASLFARGPSSPHFTAARRGLRRLGPPGRDECRRLAGSASPRVRREASLFLAESLDASAAGFLLESLATDPADGRVLGELGVLAGVDFASTPDPHGAAVAWWDMVVHDDPLAWLLAAAERAGVPAPPRELVADPLRVEGARFLLELANGTEPLLVERAVRELELRLDSELARPTTTGERGRFLADLAQAVRARYGE